MVLIKITNLDCKIFLQDGFSNNLNYNPYRKLVVEQGLLKYEEGLGKSPVASKVTNFVKATIIISELDTATNRIFET